MSRRRPLAVVALAALGSCAVVSSRAGAQGVPTPSPTTCVEIPYPPTPGISLSVAPTPIVVGDLVTLSFHVLTWPNGPPSEFQLRGAAPVFELGAEEVTGDFSGAVIRYNATALQAGTAQLVLSFYSEVAYGCRDNPVYSFGYFQSDALAVEVAEPSPSPTEVINSPTPTATPSPTPTSLTCIGDCDGDVQVIVSEILTGVNMALGNMSLDSCPTFGCCAGEICAPEVSCILGAVDNALNGCPTARAVLTMPTP